MGGNSSQQKQPLSSKVLPKFCYLNRSANSLLLFENSPFFYFTPDNLTFFVNSAICETEGVIFVAGGSNKLGSLQKLFFCINTQEMKAKTLNSLPIPSKYGYLKPYKNTILYAGGVCLDPLSKRKVQSPIMRYERANETWEILNHSNLIFSKSQKLQFKDLKKPGFFMAKNRLLMFGGYFNVNNTRIANKSVLSFDLTSDLLDFSSERIEFPFRIYSPVVGEYKTRAIIAGGKLLDSQHSQEITEYKRKKFSQVKNQSLKVYENYPVVYSKSFIIILAFPKVHIRENSSKDWLQFPLPSGAPTKIISFEIPTAEGEINLQSKQAVFTPNSTKLFSSMGSSLDPFDTTRTLSFTQREDVEFDIDFIMSRESDDRVTICHKQAIKLFAFLMEKLENKKLNGLDLNQISVQLGNKGFVSISEMCCVFTELLQKKGYPLESLIKFYHVVHKVVERPRVRSGIILKMLGVGGIQRNSDIVICEHSIFILTRIIKLTVVGV